jgi:hypothetical protein
LPRGIDIFDKFCSIVRTGNSPPNPDLQGSLDRRAPPSQVVVESDEIAPHRVTDGRCQTHNYAVAALGVQCLKAE